MCIQRSVLLAALTLVLTLSSGCTATPETVFMKSTQAFADGDVEHGMSYLSQRLRDTVSENDLKHYYSMEDHRKAMVYVLEDATFQLLNMDTKKAHGRVVWTTGRIEDAYFVMENGVWKIDLPPVKAADDGDTGSGE